MNMMEAVGGNVNNNEETTETSKGPSDKWTCSNGDSVARTTDEIVIESFSDPSFNWITTNDPVMGGESYSSVEMMSTDGTAVFTGEVKDVPFLGCKSCV
jgi:hypothetical protein